GISASNGLGGLAAARGGGDERGVAPGEVFGRSLRARCAIELFREIPARRRVGLHSSHETIAALEGGVHWAFAAQAFPKTRILVGFRQRGARQQRRRQFEVELSRGER